MASDWSEVTFLEIFHGFLVFIEARVSQSHPAISFTVAGVHVNSSLTILNCDWSILLKTASDWSVVIDDSDWLIVDKH